MKALLYCTKAKPYLIRSNNRKRIYTTDMRKDFLTQSQVDNMLNGLIVAECDIDKVTENDLVFDCRFNKQSQLYINEMIEYVGDKNYYCLHLSNVKVFDEPEALWEYLKHPKLSTNVYGCEYVKKAPQNMMEVSHRFGGEYILISIQPQWLCKILNGEKTIEVRKQILNCLKEMVE